MTVLPSRRVLRHWLPVLAGPTRIATGGPVLHVAAARMGTPPTAEHVVEFWAEGSLEEPGVVRTFQVFGTGQELPAGAQWRGTTERTPDGLVWHLYELTD